LKDEHGEIVFVITPDGMALLNPPPLQITSFSPLSGFDGTIVTILGTDFVDVQLGNNPVAHTVDSPTQISVEATSPGGFFKVQTAYGVSVSNTRFILRSRTS
jgi:IPT/TIG domain